METLVARVKLKDKNFNMFYELFIYLKNVSLPILDIQKVAFSFQFIILIFYFLKVFSFIFIFNLFRST